MIRGSRRASRRLLGAVVALALVFSACGGTSGGAPPSSSDAATTTIPSSGPAAAPDIVVSPEFINGAIPASPLTIIVGLADPGSGLVVVTADAPGADVVVHPPTISGVETAEVTVVPGPTDTDTEIEVAITAEQGGSTRTVSRVVTVVPWEDDRGDQARTILGLFDDWLAEAHPEFGITPETEFAGSYTAPLLLIVSHYAFFSDAWEVGVSWHIMVPPDDFAEVYLRPRGEMSPTHAYRIGSWQTALETGEYEITEIAPPSEVIR